MQSLKEFDKEKLDDALLKKVGKFTASPDFTYDNVNKVSAAASGMCKWVHAMETYGYVAKDVAPKRAKLKAAQVGLHGDRSNSFGQPAPAAVYPHCCSHPASRTLKVPVQHPPCRKGP